MKVLPDAALYDDPTPSIASASGAPDLDAIAIADKTGHSIDFVKRNKTELQSRFRVLDAERVLAEAPEEARDWLADKSNAEIVSDDFSVVGRIKKTISDIEPAYEAGGQQLGKSTSQTKLPLVEQPRKRPQNFRR